MWVPKRGVEQPGIRKHLELEYYATIIKKDQALNVLMWNPVGGILRGESKVQSGVWSVSSRSLLGAINFSVPVTS